MCVCERVCSCLYVSVQGRESTCVIVCWERILVCVCVCERESFLLLYYVCDVLCAIFVYVCIEKISSAFLTCVFV